MVRLLMLLVATAFAIAGCTPASDGAHLAVLSQPADADTPAFTDEDTVVDVESARWLAEIEGYDVYAARRGADSVCVLIAFDGRESLSTCDPVDVFNERGIMLSGDDILVATLWLMPDGAKAPADDAIPYAGTANLWTAEREP